MRDFPQDVYPELETYLDTLCYLFLTDENMRRQCDRCGIRFAVLPKTEGTKAASRAQEIASFELAKHEFRDDARFLEYGGLDFRQVPDDDTAFLEKLNGLLEIQKIYELCLNGTKDPKGARERIRNFQESMASEVIYGPLSAIMSVHLAEWQVDSQNNEAKTIIQNFEMLSEMVGGFNPGRIGLLLGGSGYGKTNLGLLLALNARHTMPTAYVNQEMLYKDIVRRIAVLERGITHSEFYEKVKSDAFVRSEFPDNKGLHLTNGQSLSVNQIKGWVRSLSRQSPIRFLVIDYDQCLNLQTSRDVPEWKALQLALTDFDNFSREMGCFILVLAQINREGEISGSFRSNFKSHVTLKFHEDDDDGAIIQAIKSRNGKTDAYVKVDYHSESSAIREVEVCMPKKKKQKRAIELRKQTQDKTKETMPWIKKY